MIDPFEGKIFAYSPGSDNYEEQPYELEEYEDAKEKFFIEYNDGKMDSFEKKSDSFWLSTETGIEYDAKRKEGEFDYTPVMYELPWEEEE